MKFALVLMLVWASGGDTTAVGSKARLVLDVETRRHLLNALEKNERLHGAFFSYNGAGVERAAQELKAALGKLKHQDIEKLLKFSKEQLAKIKASRPREENNQNYHLVSLGLIHLVKSYDVGSKYNVYACPMVKKKWLQNSEKMAKVHNPYSAEMPNCGAQKTKF